MKRMAGAFFSFFLAIGCGYSAMMTANYGWEDGGEILGSYLPIEAMNVTAPEPVHSGQHSLKLVDGGDGTPEAYVAHITGLSSGDVISASFWVYDTTPGPGVSPRARIWAHYAKNNNINEFAGSAGGNTSFSDGTGWCNLAWSWTIDLGYDRTGLVIEVRTYSDFGDTVWVDDLTVTTLASANVYVPAQEVFEPAELFVISCGILLLVPRKRYI